MVNGGLARGVGVGLEQRHLDAVDRADVDHARGVLGRGRRGELREQRHREVEDRLDVEREHLVPGRVGILLDRGAPVGARVVHEDVQRRLARGELAREPLHLGVL